MKKRNEKLVELVNNLNDDMMVLFHEFMFLKKKGVFQQDLKENGIIKLIDIFRLNPKYLNLSRTSRGMSHDINVLEEYREVFDLSKKDSFDVKCMIEYARAFKIYISMDCIDFDFYTTSMVYKDRFVESYTRFMMRDAKRLKDEQLS